MANKLSQDKKRTVISALVEGNSIRSIERMTGVHRDTICRLLVRVGDGCEAMMRERFTGLDLEDVQVDEIWTTPNPLGDNLSVASLRWRDHDQP